MIQLEFNDALGKAWKRFFQDENRKFSDHSLACPVSVERIQIGNIYPKPVLKAAGQQTCCGHLNTGTVFLDCPYLTHQMAATEGASLPPQKETKYLSSPPCCLVGPSEKAVKRHAGFQPTEWSALCMVSCSSVEVAANVLGIKSQYSHLYSASR